MSFIQYELENGDAKYVRVGEEPYIYTYIYIHIYRIRQLLIVSIKQIFSEICEYIFNIASLKFNGSITVQQSSIYNRLFAHK